MREAKSLAAGHSDLQTQLEQSREQVSVLEQQLEDCGTKCRQVAPLRKELEKLRNMTQSQEQKAARNQAELSSLETIVGLLHLREVKSHNPGVIVF